ncbi:DUF771 domain-containing protein [Enterococcus faecalis]|uniref:DUF771 domain-containing protein n=1 Tax=Enterococcus faecalis TaxID=1351 RepID=UPI00114248C3|nr:DUF771 domain-containing protein [Enterococcus faecalis]NSV46309.1 DUF771 domain-containing protein [Enterococcus faecalis]TQA43025.1 DUF771 domain-containing protein [Enterococcus faecalis]
MSQKQYLEAKIPVTSDYVIISKVEYEELKKADETGNWMTLKEVLDRVNRGYEWFTSNVLKNPRYRKILDVDKNKDGFVYYPGDGRDTYLFQRRKMLEFLDENFADILKKGSN